MEIACYNTPMHGFLPFLPFFYGWFSGILVNYLADILPASRKISRPNCWSCDHPQPWLNYFLWPRRCPQCGKRRRIRVWLVELAAILIAFWLSSNSPNNLGMAWSGVLLLYFGLVFIIDIEHRLILHPVSIVGAGLGLIIGTSLHGIVPTLFGGFAGFGIMLFFYYFGEYFARFLARRRGIDFDDVALGFGDVNLAGVIGLLLGWPGIIAGLFITVFSAGAVSLLFILGMLLFRRYRAFTAIPYAPFLIFGAVIALFFKELIL